MVFDTRPVLRDAALELRPLAEADLPELVEALGDPRIWAGHPVPDRWRPEVAGPYARWLLGAGGVLALRARDSGRLLGCSRFYTGPDCAPDEVAIGYTFLRRELWGTGTNRAMKRLMLAHAFAGFRAVRFHVGAENRRSQIAVGRLGAREVARGPLDMGSGAKPYVTYLLARDDWAGA